MNDVKKTEVELVEMIKGIMQEGEQKLAENRERIKDLIRRGANPNKQDRYGWTALMWSVIWEEKELLTELLEHGADARLKTNQGDTALMWAAHMGFTELARILIPHSEVADKNMSGVDAELRAQLEGKKDTAKLLGNCGEVVAEWESGILKSCARTNGQEKTRKKI